MATVTYASAGSGNWLCPANVFAVTAACWGGGQTGVTGGFSGSAPGGGGGEYASDTVSVTPGKLYKWTVGTNSGNSFFAGDAETVIAHGAQGQAGGTGSANTTHFDGGAGGHGTGSAAGAGGGSSAGPGGAGGAGGAASAGGTGGAGGTPPAGGGAGGAGANSIPGGAGTAGSSPGGGGGGGSGHGQPGGAGAPGQVQLTYTVATQPLVPFFPAGFPLLPQDFNNLIQSPLSFLTSKVAFRAELTTGQVLAAGGDAVLNFNSILEDPFAGWESGSHQWLAPAGYTGTYEVAVTASCAQNPGGLQLQALVGLNSKASLYGLAQVAVPGTSSTLGNALASGAVPVQLYGGQDTVQGFALVTGPNGGTTVSTAGQRCEMTITFQNQ